ncbi:permease [Salinisphaera hydrothermalis]|uniref:permease n=1 Tax=Salinisphaera hydrothermalis TaxID=563188 RepID=UPI003340AAD0
MIDAVSDSLLIGLGLFYKALWPILFGVLLTALIETLIDQDRLADILGGRDVLTAGKASAIGVASSACTFGAVSITQTLFKKGASAESSFAFSFASTNLVFELGILIYVLLGWQFLGAELLGGFLLIAIVYALVRLTLPRELFAQARTRLRDRFPEDPPPVRFTRGVAAPMGWKEQLTSREGWQRIARNYFHTLGKIYKSALFGFFISGFIVALVPHAFWSTLFMKPAGPAGITENAVLGVLAGVFSFIGSIGNVPFAAALWTSGVSFAGVIACIYADLITVPIMNLWQKFFGWKAAAYIFVVFFVTMVASAVAMEYLFDTLGWIPPRLSSQGLMSFLQVKLDFTLVMTALALAGTAALYVLIRWPAETRQQWQ